MIITVKTHEVSSEGPKPKNVCINCGQQIHHTDRPEGPGSVWTPSGKLECELISTCEHCINVIYKERFAPENDPIFLNGCN